MRSATLTDLNLLLDLMTEFYREAGYELDREHAGNAFTSVISDSRLGRIWIIERDGEAAGYLVMTFKFAMEYGGLSACLDDLYVRPAFRNGGLSSKALEDAFAACKDLGVRSISVEVAFDNGPAQKVYRRAGFQPLDDRQLLALALDKPSHLSGPQ